MTTAAVELGDRLRDDVDSSVDANEPVLLQGRVDRDAEFTAFVAAHGPALMRTAWLLCGERARGEDVAQQALVRTYLAWPRLADPLAYARRAVATARIDAWRLRRREVLVAPDDHVVAGLADTRPSGRSPEGPQAERDLLLRALRTLPRQQRRVVVLRYLVDLPEAQVAEMLGVSAGTVRSTLSRGLDRLRGLLGTVDAADALDAPGPRTNDGKDGDRDD